MAIVAFSFFSAFVASNTYLICLRYIFLYIWCMSVGRYAEERIVCIYKSLRLIIGALSRDWTLSYREFLPVIPYAKEILCALQKIISKSGKYETREQGGNYTILLTLVQKNSRLKYSVIKYTTVRMRAFQSKMCCNMLLWLKSMQPGNLCNKRKRKWTRQTALHILFWKAVILSWLHKGRSDFQLYQVLEYIFISRHSVPFKKIIHG